MTTKQPLPKPIQDYFTILFTWEPFVYIDERGKKTIRYRIPESKDE